MLEVLLVSFCLNAYQTPACSSAEQAWYKQSGTEKDIFNFSQRLENHYKEYTNEFIVLGTLATIATQHNYTTKIMSIKGIDVITSFGDTNSLTFKKSY